MITQVISTSGHLIPKFPEVRFHRTRIFISPTHCLLLLAIEAGDLLDSVKIKLDKSRIRHYEGTIDGERMKELGEKI